MDFQQLIADFAERHSIANLAAEDNAAALVVRLLENYLAAEHVRDFRISKSDMIRRINAGFQKNLNERPWVEINKDIHVSVGNRPVSLRSTISPAENIGCLNEGDRGPILSRYPASVHGYMCDSSTADHAVNLSVSSISVGDQGGAQTVAFKGVRHGVHSAWGIRNAQARSAANVRRGGGCDRRVFREIWRPGQQSGSA